MDITSLLKQISDAYNERSLVVANLQATNTSQTASIANLNNQIIELQKTITDLKKQLDNPVPPVVPPVVPTNGYTKTFRYSLAKNAYKFGLLPSGIVKTIPDSKGNITMKYVGKAQPTLGLSVITKDGLLFLQNQENVKFTADISDKSEYPIEIWWAWYKPDFFMFEKYVDEPVYAGDMGSAKGIRFTNDNTENHQFASATVPVDQFSIFRIRLTANGIQSVNVELWINGVKQTNPVPVTGWFRRYFTLGVGADTNNAYSGWAEIFTTPVLTDEQANKITAEMLAEYKPLQLPIATDISLSYDKNGNKTVSYKYKSPNNIAEDKNALKVRWVDWNRGGPQASTYRPDLDNKLTVPANFQGTVQVTVVDVNGNYFDIPSNKYFNN